MPNMLKKVSIYLVVSFVLAVAIHSAEAANVNVITSFDKRTVDIEDEVHMTIKVVGRVGNLQRPRLPQFNDFTTYYTGRASNFSFIAGKSIHTLEFKYVLVPQKTGTFTVGPFEVPVGNTVFRTEPITLTVISVGGKTTRQAPYKPVHTPPGTTGKPYTPTPAAPPPRQARLPVQGADQDLFIRVTSNKQVVYPNEQVTLTYTLYTRMNVRYEGYEEEPEMMGFWVEDLPEKTNLAREEVYMNGKRYAKAEIRKVAIFPTRAGEYTIKPGTIKCSVKVPQTRNNQLDPFFQDKFFGSASFARRQQRLLETEPIKIKIMPFPDKDKPESFTGLSGAFRLNVSLDKKRVKQNEPIIMTIVVEGTGNIDTIERPFIEETRDFKVYDKDMSTQLNKDRDTIQGSKSFDIMFIPMKSGELAIPAVSFNYFNLQHKTYMELENGPFPITVQAVSSDESLESLATLNIPEELKEEIQIETKDIQYIKPKMTIQMNARARIRDVLILIDALLALLLVVIIFMKRKRDVLDKDVVLRRKVFALNNVKKRVKELKKLANTNDSRFFEESATALDQYVADKFNLSAYGLTWGLVEEKLHSVALDEDAIKKCKEFYESCNFARFGSSTISKEEYVKISSLFSWIINHLEGKIR